MVSNQGRVKNVLLDHILKPRNNSYGLMRVSLRKDGVTYERYIHLLVAKAFISGWRWGTRVRHHDEDKSNNAAHNLRFREGQRMGHLRKDFPDARVRRIRIPQTGDVFRTVDDCARYIGGDRSSIYSVLRGERLTHKGYTFEYYWEDASVRG